MGKITKKKELWHIPKRGNIHQAIFMVYVINSDKFNKKAWNSGKQENIASEMSKVGLTNSGKALTPQSVRTLLANLPKYLGFIFIDESTTPAKLMVTDAGNELIEHHQVEKIKKQKSLGEYQRKGLLINTSPIFLKQLSKLIITNPIIKNDCQNIIVFPFRVTLKLLLKLGYLDIEELAYIVFHMKTEREFSLVLQKIKNFRSLPPIQRTKEITAYRKTPEGNLTLEKAPSSRYYMTLCCATGLCSTTTVRVNKTIKNGLAALQLSNKILAKQTLNKFRGANIFDFQDDMLLWKEYFTTPRRLFPPFMAEIKTNTKDEYLITVEQNNVLRSNGIIVAKTFSFPVFRNEKYKVKVYNIYTNKVLFDKDLNFTETQNKKNIKIKSINTIKYQQIAEIKEKIEEMISNKYDGFDKEYYYKLKTIRDVLGKNYFHNYYKGGRFEYLFFKLLVSAKKKKKIDDVYWYGKEDINEYGLAKPAPGGKHGNPDIVFEIDKYKFVLEVTTYHGNRNQWNSSEASSVPDHIAKHRDNKHYKSTIGIFSAPSIHHQLQKNLNLNAKSQGVAMLFYNSCDFAELFTKPKKIILTTMLNLSKKQLKV